MALLATSAAAQAAAPIEGRWTNPKRNVVIEVGKCGPAYCGKVAWASEKAKATARKGGTKNLVGATLMTGFKPVGNGTYRGGAFDPKRRAARHRGHSAGQREQHRGSRLPGRRHSVQDPALGAGQLSTSDGTMTPAKTASWSAAISSAQ